MKFLAERPFADPEPAARKVVELAGIRAGAGGPHLHREVQRTIHLRVEGHAGGAQSRA